MVFPEFSDCSLLLLERAETVFTSSNIKLGTWMGQGECEIGSLVIFIYESCAALVGSAYYTVYISIT